MGEAFSLTWGGDNAVVEDSAPNRSLVVDRPSMPQPGGIDRGRLVAANDAAAQFFAHQLHSPAGGPPREYLRARGFGPFLDSSLWSLGYAPPSWTALTEHLHGHGYEDRELLAAGLVTRTRRGSLVDRFRDRVTLPLHDRHGETVGFVGRAAPHAAGDAPKYLNSPRTPLYDKRHLLFGLAEQRDLLSAGGLPVIVEGPLDVLAVHAANAHHGPPLAGVAPCGTALTQTQVDSLAGISGDRVLVAFDADAAGGRAAAGAYPLLARAFTQLQAADLPAAGDPAGLLQARGSSAVRQALSRTGPLADRVLDHGLRPWVAKLDNAEARIAALREVVPTIVRLRADEVSRQAGRLAQRLDLEPVTVTRELADAVTTSHTQGHSHVPRSTRRAGTGPSPVPAQRLAAHHGIGLE